MKKYIFMFSLFACLFSVAFFASGEARQQGNLQQAAETTQQAQVLDNSQTCQNLWWHDNNSASCEQKQFCGAYMYFGLKTFSTKGECDVSLLGVSKTDTTQNCPVGCTCSGETTTCPVNPSVCQKGETKQYKCSDGTMVDWCFCGDNGVWASAGSPEAGCSSVKKCQVGCVCYSNGVMACPMAGKPVQASVKATEGVSTQASSETTGTSVTTSVPVTILIGEDSDGKTTIGNGNIQATSTEKVRVVENKLFVEGSNGKNSEIKIMPETASAKAIERLGEVQNVQIELKQVGNGDNAKPTYQVSAQKEVRFLGMFKMKMQVSAQVNSDTGEAVKIQKPWWSFLAW